jgi:hypothetical protein
MTSSGRVSQQRVASVEGSLSSEDIDIDIDADADTDADGEESAAHQTRKAAKTAKVPKAPQSQKRPLPTTALPAKQSADQEPKRARSESGK